MTTQSGTTSEGGMATTESVTPETHEFQFNLADVFESIADGIPDRNCLSFENTTLSYRGLDDAASQVGHFWVDAGVAPGDHVALYLLNSVEHVSALIGLLKVRAVPINVNYRYTAPELDYLFRDSDSSVIVVELPEHQDLLAGLVGSLPRLRTVLVVGETTSALAEACGNAGVAVRSFAEHTSFPTARDFAERSGDDHYVIYTGGTTGYPKGVIWRQHDFFCKPVSQGNPYGEGRSDLEDLRRGMEDFPPMTVLNTPPLMHGAASFTLFTFLCLGCHIVLVRQFDADEVVRLVEQHAANIVVIVGDGMGSPLADAMQRLQHEVDLSSLFSVSSGGALFSGGVRDRMLAVKPDLVLRDNLGASESGNDGFLELDEAGNPTMPASPDVFVLDDANQPIPPGSDQIGSICRAGHVPVGYYNDPEKTARTFVTLSDGRRGSLVGDMGRITGDGTIVFLGRNSQCINTGGEKVFAEEVEAAIHSHPDVVDALVVGTPDERLGSRVAAVIATREGTEPTLEEIQEHCSKTLARYKLPRNIELVPEIRRTPAGKADYSWAKSVV